jgi:hypothetical protein
MKCGGTDLDAVYSAKGAFVGSYHCKECDVVGPVITFDDLESYDKFKVSLKNDDIET